jgi:hypothetical protein
VSIRTAEVAPRASTSSYKSQHGSERIKRRRAWALLTMTLAVPGSAQLVAGNRRVGRVAIRVWAVLWLLALLTALLAWILPEAALSMITFGPSLKLIQFGLVALGLGWVGLIVDAWRLTHPRELGSRGRLVFSVITLALAFAIFVGSIAVHGVRAT